MATVTTFRGGLTKALRYTKNDISASSILNYGTRKGLNINIQNGMIKRRFCLRQAAHQRLDLTNEVDKFAADLQVDEAVTPPSSWFVKPEFLDLEKEAVFKKSWTAVGRTDQVQEPGQYFAGTLADEPFVVVRDGDNKLQAFFNVCRHHASRLVQSGEGSCKKFTCPYHGWTYLLNGRLAKATRLKGIKNFSAKNFGLVPIRVHNIGPLVFVYLGNDEPPDLEKQYGEGINAIDQAGFYNGLTFVKRVVFPVNCNWKVFVDNYLDGGYHVSVLHKDLTANLDMSSYKIQVTDDYSIQTVCGIGDDRVGSNAYYVYLYPNVMLNRYGPWLDVNLVLPVGHDKCEVVYDYYLEDSKLSSMTPEETEEYIIKSLNDSKQVQDEDQWICENVQAGLKSSAYDVGRYAPHVEMADHRFHQRLARDFKNYLKVSGSES